MRGLLLAAYHSCLVLALIGASPLRAQVVCGYVYDNLIASSDCTWNGTTISCPDPWVWTCVEPGAGAGTSGSGGNNGGNGGTSSTPLIAELPLPTGQMATNITQGKQRAGVKVANFSDCASLFANLGIGYPKTPSGVLSTASYRDGRGTSYCGPGVGAAAPVGGALDPSTNFIIGCGQLASVIPLDAIAILLIHEASHLAGYSHSMGLDNDALNGRITDRCHF